MTEATTALTNAPLPVAPGRVSITRAVLRNPLGLSALIILTLIILISVVAPFFAPHSPTEVKIDKILAMPSSDYPLGGDGAGRDVFSRLIWAGQNTLLGALIAVSISLVLGSVAGLVAGYFGKVFDTTFSWAANILMALPAMIVLLALYQTLGGSVYSTMAVFGVMLSPGFFRLVRNQVIAVKNELYVDAARVSGLSDARIISRHILRVVRSPIIIQTAIIGGIAIIIQSGLEFLGLGDPATPTWGGMLQDAFSNIYINPAGILWPGLIIAATVASLVLLGNAIRDELGGPRASAARPRAKPRHGHAHARTQGTEALNPGSGNGPLLRVRDLHVGYGSIENPLTVVRGVSFDVTAGEIVGIVGESGSGKTQTAFSILGLLPRGGRVLSGSIKFRGRDITFAPGNEMQKIRGRDLSYIPQEPMSNLDPSFTIGHQLVEPMQAVFKISKAEARKRSLVLLARVGIADPERTFRSYPHEISGGMAQRVLIAGAVSCGPKLLIADEPTTALDVTVQAEVLDLLRDLQREMGMGIVLVTHNFGVVADLCDRVVVMQNGRVVETNDAETLFSAPSDPYTQALLAATLDDSPPRPPLAVTAAGTSKGKL
ncbi:dipeptide/oligopeptide/nickel ABC transporter permease/ATP-binding protein [Arthrobacter sp. MI7-26]|uniref:dipeptide/oligopeptide/nickel ABC transporter permease/ATP-binding protein n=1 Tax=Arthrobacter sp. MI7-26 TaxID=2993653 RepID=UPI0022492700|nr:dipeptide/oligopeptide/nickel ABC transporter permease/ATP-binding protein [Arthrobacter sp. MI7-26]MCX2746827.1 dipeptide/oligopeptide/nickel ABC transporter permease/ATP-binding protein [Arthrobacter sp. MI7-26]